MLDVVGFDTGVPAVISDFVRTALSSRRLPVQGQSEGNNAGGWATLRPRISKVPLAEQLRRRPAKP